MFITFDESAWIYRVLGIDNGTNLVGISVIDHDLRSRVSTVISAYTFAAEDVAYNRHPDLVYSRDNLTARIRAIRNEITDVLEIFHPHAVGIESPFQHVHAHSFAALTLSMAAIGEAVEWYSSTMEFVKIAPGKAKKAMIPQGVKFNSDKDFIHQCILSNKDIVAGPGVDLRSLGPDALDSVAVGHTLALTAVL